MGSHQPRSLARWHPHSTVGKDIDFRVTIHVLGVIHKGLDGKLTAHRQEILGMPSRTPTETVSAIDAIRAEMADVGRYLADKYKFAYPYELEEVVRRIWDENKEALARR